MLDELVLEPAAAAFLEVGTFVAFALAGFGLLRWRLGDRLPAWLEAHRHRGPLAGALLGAFPGCGGAIVVIPLYLKGQVSFGTIVATLTATMGDSSFVLLAADPVLAVGVHAGLIVVGAVTGLVVDRLGIEPRRTPVTDAPAGSGVVPRTASTFGTSAEAAAETETAIVATGLEPSPSASPTPSTSPTAAAGRRGVRPSVGAAARISTSATPLGLAAFWVVTAAAMVVAVPTVFQLVEPSHLEVSGVPTTTVLGLTGAVMAVAITLTGRGRGHADHANPPPDEHPRTVLMDAAEETARVTTWVVVAFVGYEVAVATTGLDVGTLPTIGLLGVVAGALLGLVPGCGPQLVLTGLYAQGVLPLSVLAANALSQDGDALIPLLASDRRAAVLASVITLVPALLVGAAIAAIGF